MSLVDSGGATFRPLGGSPDTALAGDVLEGRLETRSDVGRWKVRGWVDGPRHYPQELL